MRLILILTALLLSRSVVAQVDPPARGSKAAPDIPFEGQADAPDFPQGLEWLNTARPLSLTDLRGKVVLLDFWTYCCINCMHIIPDLKKLEEKYARELVVIGVHSAKFDNEKLSANIRQAVQRYEIEHPVVNDSDFAVWRAYGARAWPSLYLINPQGRIIGRHSGEGIYGLFDEVIGATVKHFDAKKRIDRRPIKFELEKDKSPRAVLSYPGKIVADEASKRLFFTDSNHNRVIVAGLDGQVLQCIGEGRSGLKDGPFTTAKFFRPQGLCFDRQTDRIYVADTENHAVRLIDLKTQTVTTLAGTGRQARRFGLEGKGVELNSPWDLVLVGDILYIAMAGPHQLWSLNTRTLEARVYAGSGRENIVDGPLKEAALAQPSGITFDGARLYFADSEVSAIRAADLRPDGRVETLIGQGLFEFGDVDGKYPQARLQHCLGVAHHDGFLYVVDTYNHKIKKLDPKTREVSTFLGTGKRGRTDGPGRSAGFSEPSGLCFADGKMFIADANNHLVRVCDLKTLVVSTLEFKGIEKLAEAHRVARPMREIQLEARRVGASTQALEFTLALPLGTKLNPEAPSKLKVASEDANVIEILRPEILLQKEAALIQLSANTGRTNLKLHLTLFYCDAGNAGLCYLEDVSLVVPVEVSGTGEEKVAIAHAVKAPTE